jgi:hypothetical protein
MNFQVGLFQETWSFWLVIAVINFVAPITVAIAKMRDRI